MLSAFQKVAVSSTIFIGLFLAWVLTIVPLPEGCCHPAWGLLVSCGFTLFFPYQFNIGWAWLTGLFIDVLTNSLLGEHAFSFVIIIFFVGQFYQRIKLFPLHQQTLFILVLSYLNQCYLFVIQSMINAPPTSDYFWWMPWASVLIWPWFVTLLLRITEGRRAW